MLKKSMAKVTRTPRRSITFTVEDAPGKQVAVAGTFNDWTPDRPLLDKEGNGIYSCRMMLEPGTYEYKFVVDGEWKLDSNNPNFAPNDLGTLNSVLVVQSK